MPRDLTASQPVIQPYAAKPGAAGAILLAATLLEVLAMAHHPSVHTPDVAAAVQQIGQLAKLSAWVHGVVLSAMLCIAYGMLEFTLRRGWSRPWIRAGSIAYGSGALVMIGAGLVSGFILPGLAAATPHVSAIDLAINAQLLVLCRELNQSCANFATVAMSAGMLCWSLDLLGERGRVRWLGILGVLTSVLPATLLVSGALRLNVQGMSEVVWLWALWNFAVALSLWRPAGLQPQPA
jgi:hypothetical protein